MCELLTALITVAALLFTVFVPYYIGKIVKKVTNDDKIIYSIISQWIVGVICLAIGTSIIMRFLLFILK